MSLPVAIMHVGNFLSWTGCNRSFIEELADRLEQAGWRVYRTSSLPSRPVRLADMATAIWLKRHRIAVAHIAVFSGPAFIWAEVSSLMMRAVRRPYVLSLHGGNLPKFAARWPSRMRRLLESAAKVVTPSPFLFEKMSEYRCDLTLFPNPIDLSCYDFTLRKRANPKLVWMRAFHNIYNPALAPKVLALLMHDLPDACLTMIGPDTNDASLKSTQRTAAEVGVSDRLSLPGRIPKQAVSAWLNRGDVLLNTTNIDNTPVSLLEAMACGLCIVSTNVGGIPYLLEDGLDALLVPPDNPEAMAAAVKRIFAEPGLSERLSLNARKKVEQFDWSVILPRWEQLFASVIGEQEPGGVSSTIKSRSKKLTHNSRHN
ncbi:MAG: glycosyltransferase family 4 protein [Pyrinomonadaceae bacterium]|nr:glycosyltransferase family 4 protein [Pyrinomonadaceae bacterium]